MLTCGIFWLIGMALIVLGAIVLEKASPEVAYFIGGSLVIMGSVVALVMTIGFLALLSV